MVSKIAGTRTYIEKNGTTYRFSTTHNYSDIARSEAQKWRNAGHPAIVVKNGKQYDVFYRVKKSQFTTERAYIKRANQGKGSFGRRGDKELTNVGRRTQLGKFNPFKNLDLYR